MHPGLWGFVNARPPLALEKANRVCAVEVRERQCRLSLLLLTRSSWKSSAIGAPSGQNVIRILSGLPSCTRSQHSCAKRKQPCWDVEDHLGKGSSQPLAGRSRPILSPKQVFARKLDRGTVSPGSRSDCDGIPVTCMANMPGHRMVKAEGHAFPGDGKVLNTRREHSSAGVSGRLSIQSPTCRLWVFHLAVGGKRSMMS